MAYPVTFIRGDGTGPEIGEAVRRVLFLYVPKEVLIERLGGRWVCSNCAASYNVKTHPPKVPGVCDLCGHTLVQRVDDRTETVTERINVYLELTVPLIQYYRERGLLVEVDGNRPEDEVTRALTAAVDGAPAQGSAKAALSAL